MKRLLLVFAFPVCLLVSVVGIAALAVGIVLFFGSEIITVIYSWKTSHGFWGFLWSFVVTDIMLKIASLILIAIGAMSKDAVKIPIDNWT